MGKLHSQENRAMEVGADGHQWVVDTGIPFEMPSSKVSYISNAAEGLGLDEDELWPIIELFFEEAEKNCSKMAGDSIETEEFTRLSHSMKSSANMLMFDDIRDTAFQMERLGRDKQRQVEEVDPSTRQEFVSSLNNSVKAWLELLSPFPEE